MGHEKRDRTTRPSCRCRASPSVLVRLPKALRSADVISICRRTRLMGQYMEKTREYKSERVCIGQQPYSQYLKRPQIRIAYLRSPPSPSVTFPAPWPPLYRPSFHPRERTLQNPHRHNSMTWSRCGSNRTGSNLGGDIIGRRGGLNFALQACSGAVGGVILFLAFVHVFDKV